MLGPAVPTRLHPISVGTAGLNVLILQFSLRYAHGTMEAAIAAPLRYGRVDPHMILGWSGDAEAISLWAAKERMVFRRLICLFIGCDTPTLHRMHFWFCRRCGRSLMAQHRAP